MTLLTMIRREQLENVVQKRKVGEVYQWFHDHFVKSPKEVYVNRCPFLMIQGPTGCGKTTTLRCIARELKLSVQEYSETTDTTAINYDLANSFHDDFSEEKSHTIDKRRAAKFERFVIEHLRFTTLYPVSDEPTPPSADSEFESDDDFPNTLATKAPPQPKPSGVIIHIEAPLSFSRSQRVLAQALFRLAKIIKDLSRTTLRRIAIVFENLECEKEVVSLPTKLKNSLGMHTIKFNPIIRANMKRFIETLLRNHPNIIVDKEAIELLISDSDGDLRACINTFELICNKTNAYNSIVATNNDLNSLRICDINQVNKRQRLNPQRCKFDPNLLRDVTKSTGFFHLLGKIFYQKRLYPDPYHSNLRQQPRAIDRPYRAENSTEYLMNKLDISSKNLIAWLHQHYGQFCGTTNVSKASLFLEHLSEVDTISIDATQSSQYYEMHNIIDKIQSHLAIESTVFSLYEDQSKVIKSSHKRIRTELGQFVIKPSVEKSPDCSGELYSFGRPASLSVQKLADDFRLILSHCTSQLMQSNFHCSDSTKILVDYVPYLTIMAKNLSTSPKSRKLNGSIETIPPILGDHDLNSLFGLLNSLQYIDSKMDYEEQHEILLDIIQDIEQGSRAQVTSFLDE